MRKFSFANESTRYCNYYNNKFGSQLTFIIPSWCKTPILTQALYKFVSLVNCKDHLSDLESYFYESLNNSEENYMHLLDMGCSPQEAREVLPLATKSELIMTGFVSDWQHLFDLRVEETTGKAHPDIVQLLTPLYNKFIENKWL